MGLFDNYKKNSFIKKAYKFLVQGKFQDAIEYYDKALKINPKDSDSLISKGYALSDLKNYDEAIKYYDKALKISKILIH